MLGALRKMVRLTIEGDAVPSTCRPNIEAKSNAENVKRQESKYICVAARRVERGAESYAAS